MSLLPLQGFTVGVTADRRWSEQAELLERRGAVVVHGPAIDTEYLGSDDALRSATVQVIQRRPAYLVATTGIGIRAWFEAAQAWGMGEDLSAALGETRIVARGPKAAAAVQAAGLDVGETVPSERLDDLVGGVLGDSVRGRAVAFQLYGERSSAAVDALRDAGAEVVEVPVYRWRLPADDTPARRLVDAACDGQLDAVTFTSAPAVHNLVAIAGREDRDADLLAAFNERGVLAGCVGPVCAEGARRVGIERPVAPERGRMGLLVRAVADELQQRRRALRAAGATLVFQGRAASVDDHVVTLTPQERAMLDILLRRPRAVVAKSALLRDVWGGAVDPHALEAAVARLRRRLGPAAPALRSVRGRGYSLDVDALAG